MQGSTPVNPQLPPLPQQIRPPSANPNFAPPPLIGQQQQNTSNLPSNGENLGRQTMQHQISSQAPNIQKYPAQPPIQQYPQVNSRQ